MKFVSFLAITFLISSVLFSAFFITHDALYIVGGEHVIQNGETLKGDLYVLFADVTLEEGANVNGNLFSLCSDVDILGKFEGGAWSLRALGYSILIPDFIYLNLSR